MADSKENEEEISPPFLNLPPPTTFSLIFPPNNHENLHVTPSPPSSLSSFPSSSSWDDTSPPSSPLNSFHYPSTLSHSSFQSLTKKVNDCPNSDLGLGAMTGKVNATSNDLCLGPLPRKVNRGSNLELALTRKVNVVSNKGRWNLELGLEALTKKVNGAVVFLRRFWVVRGVLLFFGSPIGSLLLVLLYLRWRRRRTRGRRVGVGSTDGSDGHLVRVIRDKDEVA